MALSRIHTESLASNTITVNHITDNTVTSTKLTTTGVVANSYGNSTSIPVITIDAAGRVTNASTSSVSGVTGLSFEASNNTLTVATSITNYSANIQAGLNQAYSNVFNGGTFSGNVTFSSNITGNSISLSGSMQIDGDLIVTGNTVTMNVSSLSVEDNMIYLNASSNVANPDLGIAGNYNDGTYRHTGVFRDATDGVWKFFHQYVPEPDASAYIDTANNTFVLANVQGNYFIGSITGSANSASYLGGNTASDLRSFSSNADNLSTGTVPVARLTGNATFTEVFSNGWFRNNDATEGLYNQTSGNHWYSTNDGYWNVTSGGRTYGGIKMRATHEGTVKGYSAYWDGNGSGILGSGGSWSVNINPSTDHYITIGGSYGDNAYNATTGRRLMFGGSNSDAQSNYYIGTNQNDVGGNYNKLDLAWHTGIRAGAQSGYGGIRFFDSEDFGSVQWQFNGGSGYTYKYNWLYTNTNGIYSDTNSMHIAPNTDSSYGSVSVQGSRNSWWGIHIQGGGYKPHVMWENGNGGFYLQDAGRWPYYYNYSNNCSGIGGSTTASGYAIRPNGNQYTDGYIYASAYYYTSDERKKEYITTIPNALEKILQLRGVNFYWRENAKVVAGRRSGGLIAQEVKPIIPEAVFVDVNDEDIKDALGLDTTPIIGYLVEAIKELKKEIDELKGAK